MNVGVMMVGENGACGGGVWRDVLDFLVGFDWEIVCDFYWCLIGILFDYLYLFYGLYWWILVCLVGGTSGFEVVSITLFTWCFVMVCG